VKKLKKVIIHPQNTLYDHYKIERIMEGICFYLLVRLEC